MNLPRPDDDDLSNSTYHDLGECEVLVTTARNALLHTEDEYEWLIPLDALASAQRQPVEVRAGLVIRLLVQRKWWDVYGRE